MAMFQAFGGVSQPPPFSDRGQFSSAQAAVRDQLHALALRSQAAAGLGLCNLSIYPLPPREKTFKDELQEEVDEWLSGIVIKHG